MCRFLGALLLVLAAFSAVAGGAVQPHVVNQAVTLAAHIPLSAFPSHPTSAADCWGFVDGAGREYAIIGLSNGTAILNITEPSNPVIIGFIPGPSSEYRDMQTLIVDPRPGSFKAYCYVVTEEHQGLQIIDLSNVPYSVSLANVYRGKGFETAHNIYVDSTSDPPFAYVVGSNLGVGGIRILSLADPVNPVEVGSWEAHWVHDILVSNQWADPNYNGKTVAFAFSRHAGVDVIDMSDRSAPVLIRNFAYPGIGYAHSGAVSTDRKVLYINDETDERLGYVSGTTIRMADISDIANARVVSAWTFPAKSIDHQSFVKNYLLYSSAYTSGLLVADISNELAPRTAGVYDTFEASDNATFNGAWGVYPYYNSDSVIISDITGGLFILQFHERARLVYRDRQIEDNVIGNSDGIIQPGETIDLPVTIQNTGMDAASSIAASLSSTNPLATVLTGTAGYPNLPAGGSGSSQPPYRIAFDAALPCPGIIPVQLNIRAAGGLSWQQSTWLPVGLVPFFDDFESGAPGWFHSADQGKDKWALSGRTFHSAATSWRGTTGARVRDDQLYMPEFQVPSGGELHFWQRFDTQQNADGLVIEYSAAGPEGPWNDLGSLSTQGGYNSTITSATSPIFGRQAWSGASNGWMESVIPLAGFSGSTLSIRFRLTSDGSFGKGKWYVDDVAVVAQSGGCNQ